MAKAPTGRAIAEYLKTLEHKRQLESQARNLGKMVSIQETEFAAYIEAQTKGMRVQAVEISGYRLELKPKPKSVSWASEFVKRLGADLAEQVKQAAGVVKKLSVTALTARAANAATDKAA